MSSKYFAKLLPVPGGIKPGDRIWNQLSGYGTVDSQEPDDLCVKYDKEEHVVEEDLDAVHKVAMHLCDHDLSVGDTVYIIGLISPAATWVKEGDEFYEDQVEITAQIKLGENTMRIGKPWPDNHDGLEAQIKCPTCGTFH